MSEENLGMLRESLRAAEKNLEKYEDAKESLERFQQSVNGVRGDFSSADQNRKRIVEGLSEYLTECKCAKEYMNGDNTFCSDIGSGIIRAALIGLTASIVLKLTGYGLEIKRLRAECQGLRAAIDLLDMGQ